MKENNKNLKVLYAVNLILDEVVAKLEDKTAITRYRLDLIRAKNEFREASIRHRTVTIKVYFKFLPLLLGTKFGSRQDGNASEKPPQLAKFIIYLCIPKSNREAILGDLEEEFHEAHKEFGLSKAKFLYCTQVLRSIWPIIGGVVGKLIKSSIKLFTAT